MTLHYGALNTVVPLATPCFNESAPTVVTPDKMARLQRAHVATKAKGRFRSEPEQTALGLLLPLAPVNSAALQPAQTTAGRRCYCRRRSSPVRGSRKITFVMPPIASVVPSGLNASAPENPPKNAPA